MRAPPRPELRRGHGSACTRVSLFNSTSRGAQELERFLHGHLDRVRDVRPLANSRIVLIIERNYGGAVLASRIANACAPYAPVAVMTQDGRGKLRRAGVVTTHQARHCPCTDARAQRRCAAHIRLRSQVKERCRVEFARMLRTRTVRFLQPFASASPTTPQDICTQLRAFHFAVKDGDDASGRGPKLYLTGKGAPRRPRPAPRCGRARTHGAGRRVRQVGRPRARRAAARVLAVHVPCGRGRLLTLVYRSKNTLLCLPHNLYGPLYTSTYHTSGTALAVHRTSSASCRRLAASDA